MIVTSERGGGAKRDRVGELVADVDVAPVGAQSDVEGLHAGLQTLDLLVGLGGDERHVVVVEVGHVETSPGGVGGQAVGIAAGGDGRATSRLAVSITETVSSQRLDT